ncbi:MAG TPA: cytochrome d ubiquinol oxidase subunit II [Bacteroidales bacterium]|nr:cytochrome d ubiquinol oxidase subunit II [Bacteroidales bacterium]
MTEAVIIVLGISLLLYVVLGGADFGAGIVEMAVGKKGAGTVSKAIAPVWEANHIWIILAVVILFNGFPLAYTVMSTYLHIPLLLALIGIIIRGTAFSFRYYDITGGNVYNYYSWFFRISSILTPFFLGMILGSIIMGGIPSSTEGSFSDVFIKPWLNAFTFSTGIFLTLLFGWIASVYLIGEAKDDVFHAFSRITYIFLVLLVLSGGLVFMVAELLDTGFLRKFLSSPISIGCVIAATVLVPFLIKSISGRSISYTRLLAGAITACIMVGWFAVQFPVMIYRAGGDHLTIWNSQAPRATMYYLMIALIAGVLIILPAFAYLFRVFKFSDESKTTGTY